MSNNESGEHIDDVLEILTNPLSRYILSVLAGIDPGVYTAPIDAIDDEAMEEEGD
ncbi:MAG: hypothetical protein ACFFFC_03455 [Candidatus Thorarchaeota archaeon]